MILFPAIDLKDGQCVRLVRGAMESADVFNDDPAAQARAFERAGFEWLHCVDLDGAVSGRAVNESAVRAIRRATSLPMQLGGGIRDLGRIEGWLALGITRVILGTAALRDPDLVKQAARSWPGKIVVGIDARGGKVAAVGWTETSDVGAVELGRRFEDAGVAAMIFTDIARDGTGQGVNVKSTMALASSVRIPVIASGGVASIGDIRALAVIPRLEGVVIGRALYEGRIDAEAALSAARHR